MFNRSHLSIISTGLYCVLTPRNYKIEPLSGNLITLRELNIEVVPSCVLLLTICSASHPTTATEVSGYEGKLS